MKILALIPARMGSSRFPGKPMAEILGKPMIGCVYNNINSCKIITDLVVATCDDVIFNYIESIGGQAVMTSNKHERASDRCAEALLKIEEQNNIKYDIVVMAQGDEPMIFPDMINKAIEPFSDRNVNVVNLMAKLTSVNEFNDPNEPKVVVDLNGDAIYFSREPIPSKKMTSDEVPMYKQVCLIPFRRDYLLKYNAMDPTELEKIESIDMNRIIENGDKVRMVLIDGNPISVDTPDDLIKVEKLMKIDIT